MRRVNIVALLLVIITGVTLAEDSGGPSDEDLAKKLANPVASLISVPFQLNYDENVGPEEIGSVWRLNVQPVIPFSLNEDWNLISRTILPVVWRTTLRPVSTMNPDWATWSKACSSPPKHPLRVDGSRALAPPSFCPRRPMICWAPRSGERGQLGLSCPKEARGPWGSWQTISGPLPVTTIERA